MRSNILGVLTIATFGMLLRGWGVTNIGVGGNDTILYYTLAEYWLNGDFVFRIASSPELFRPVLLGFNALALVVFGHSDYAIKVAYILIDGINISLVAMLAWTVSRQRTVALVSAFSYAFWPLAVWASRQELPHTLSTFLVLLTTVALARAVFVDRQPRREVLLISAGIALCAATLTHEELILLALPFGLYIFLFPGGGQRTGIGYRLKSVVLFLVFPILCGSVVFLHSAAMVTRLFDKALADISVGNGVIFERIARFTWDALLGSGSAFLAILVAFACAVLIARIIFGAGARHVPRESFIQRVDPAGVFCLGIPLLYLIIYSSLLNTLFPRGFQPLLPLVIVGVFQALGVFFSSGMLAIRGSLQSLLLVCILLLLLVSNFASFTAFNVGNNRFSSTWAKPRWPDPTTLKEGLAEFSVDARYRPSYITHWRALYDFFAAKVDSENRLLIVPSEAMFAPGRRALQTQVYFGDDAIYRLDHWNDSLSEVVKEHKIEWIIYTIGQRRTAPKSMRPYRYQRQWGERQEVNLAKAYAMPSYSWGAEYQALEGYLAAVGAQEFFPFAPNSYEAKTAKVWRLP